MRERYERLNRQTNTQTNQQTVKCPHGVAKLCTVSKDGPNKGRQFYSCKMSELFSYFCRDLIHFELHVLLTFVLVKVYVENHNVSESCSLFKWAESNLVPSDPKGRFHYFNRQGLRLVKV